MNIFFRLPFFLLHNNEILLDDKRKKELFFCETEKNCNFGYSQKEGTHHKEFLASFQQTFAIYSTMKSSQIAAGY